MKKIIFLLQIKFVLALSLVHAQTFDRVNVQLNGSPDSLINIVIIGDGYTSAQQTKFVTDATSFTNFFFTRAPYKQYRNFFNVYGIKVISAESGAKHPQTSADAECTAQPFSNPNTYFGSTFDYAGIHRLIVPTDNVNVAAVLAANFPKYDLVVVLSNTTYYGGSGGSLATSTLHTSANLIALHEIGHTFGGLADEYWAGDIYASEHTNMTATSNASMVKWKNWIGAADNAPYSTKVGVYPYGTSGNSALWYKPSNYCMMQYLADYLPYCPVCTETIIENIHSLTKSVLNYTPTILDISSPDESLKFKLTKLLKPEPNTLQIKWQLDGVKIGEDNVDSLSINQQSLSRSIHALKASVMDTTELLRIDNHTTKHVSAVTWNINTIGLPVAFTGFTATAEKQIVKLEWSTSAEINNDHFEIERSVDAIVFSSFKIVKGKGTVNLPQKYTEYDDTPPATVIYYRLSQIDLDGKKTLLGIRAVSLNKNRSGQTMVYPVPADDFIKISGTDYSGKINCVLIDISGKIIYNGDFTVHPNSIITIRPKQKPIPGAYVLRMRGTDLDKSFTVLFE
ncbi:M64 family metallopeptidase [Paracoccus sp. (in: a-proteobacteria)]|uniref:M64 family metallopeptidase n=1 Tax=Paracoccus sp. TaxID=267 RepID=UPI002AFFA167|nr:M64 family metallopeptidase [Paracoccus sp. (in: a-proteobacteria)]